jgi:hypothetical protein
MHKKINWRNQPRVSIVNAIELLVVLQVKHQNLYSKSCDNFASNVE